MLNTKFGRKMDEMYVDAMEWLKSHSYQDLDAEPLRLSTLGLLGRGYAAFSVAKKKGQLEADEFNAASVKLGQADRKAEGAYSTLWYRAQGEGFIIRAASQDDYELYQAAVKQEFGGVAPSEFNAMDLDASLDVLEKATGFCEKHFGSADPDVIAAKEAHAELDDCRRVARREEAEYATAMNVLIKARNDARRYYSAARNVLAGAMLLVDSDDISRIMPPLSSIYRTPSSAEKTAEPVVQPVEPAVLPVDDMF